MLSITKINSAKNQAKKFGGGGNGYAFYLGAPSNRQRGDFDDYARGREADLGPLPFWAGKAPALLGLGPVAEAQHVERLARGFHPITGEPLLRGAGNNHVMGVDLTFSPPKDVSAIFAGAEPGTRDALVECLQESARAALSYAESAMLTRHGRGGATKQVAEATATACYTHFANRNLEPQLHLHSFALNIGKRANSDEWSALEHRPLFDRKMAAGALFRVELAARLREMGFAIEPDGPYFKVQGITDAQRDALSTRSKEIAERVARLGPPGAHDSAARDVAALNSRAAKSEPPLPVLLTRFERMAAELGITPAAVAQMRAPDAKLASEPIAEPGEASAVIDHDALLRELMASQSCATPQQALALICERAMGKLNASECLAELDRFLESENVVRLGMTETLTPVFTSRETFDKEADISRKVRDSAPDRRHRINRGIVDARFDALETTLSAQLGVAVSLGQQRAAALHVACDTGAHAFVEGWAGAGKTTMLRALSEAYQAAGFAVVGCCQSAAASQNLARETDVPSRTIASFLLACQQGRAKLTAKSVVLLDEAGLVGTREFSLIQDEVIKAGAKLLCVGDAKQLQPVEGGGIFASLIREHGKAEISNIQRQRTDFSPLLKWLEARAKSNLIGAISPAQVQALRSIPEDARMQAIQSLCAKDPKLARAFQRWRERFDHEWMREAVECFATGQALPALLMMDARGCLRISGDPASAMKATVDSWVLDKTNLASKTLIAGTRAEVDELNHRARNVLVSRGVVQSDGMDFEIKRRDESTDIRRFAAGDRLLFTQNDNALGVANGMTGTIRAIKRTARGPALLVDLDAANSRGETTVLAPASFGRFDHAFCLTAHKSQSRTFDSAHVLAGPMADREWTYVAMSRARFATTLHLTSGAVASDDLDLLDHREVDDKEPTREEIITSWAARMSRSRAKGTTLDYAEARIATSPTIEAGQTPLSETRSSSQGPNPAFEAATAATIPEIPSQRADLDPETERDRAALALNRMRNRAQERANAMRR
ncbi:MobF family relaxase [Paraburkholderia nemoris]|uniref:MobF family relaxase n=1 Tax=Paraburkholderia nemoris TaxID=2793076 RepID=UPI0038BB5EC1